MYTGRNAAGAGGPWDGREVSSVRTGAVDFTVSSLGFAGSSLDFAGSSFDCSGSSLGLPIKSCFSMRVINRVIQFICRVVHFIQDSYRELTHFLTFSSHDACACTIWWGFWTVSAGFPLPVAVCRRWLEVGLTTSRLLPPCFLGISGQITLRYSSFFFVWSRLRIMSSVRIWTYWESQSETVVSSHWLT